MVVYRLAEDMLVKIPKEYTEFEVKESNGSFDAHDHLLASGNRSNAARYQNCNLNLFRFELII